MHIRIVFVGLLLIFFTSCQNEEMAGEDHFFVANDGAAMPVYLRGNFNSDFIILFLHGGPGGNASQATYIPSFQELEKDYMVAYWDQRASGLSQGNPDQSTFTVEQFVEDADFVVDALNLKYGSKGIVLLGHSWGGALGAAYLSTASLQEKIEGFICMNSGHNLEVGLPKSVQWIAEYAAVQIESGMEKEFWEEVKQWCDAMPDMTDPENYFEYVEYLKATDAYRHNNQEVEIDPVTIGDILNSRLSMATLMGGYFLSQNFNILELNLSDAMGRIQIPSLVLWGRHDGVNTIEMGFDAFNSIGTASVDKQMVIFENSAHEGYLEEPEDFVAAVVQFVNGLQ